MSRGERRRSLALVGFLYSLGSPAAAPRPASPTPPSGYRRWRAVCGPADARGAGSLRLAVVRGRGILEVARDDALIGLHRRHQALHELPARLLQVPDLGAYLRLGGPCRLQQLLGLDLGLADGDLRLAPSVLLHLLGDPLRGDQRVLE